jgi:predicted DNA-binding transcriptional regulator YafY
MNHVEIITSAIETRKRLSIQYNPGGRLIEPHAVGIGSSGQYLLRAFQVSGVSASGEHINWKLLRLDRLESVEVTEEIFPGPRPEYKRGDKAMTRQIIREL